jgi:hypothetical protein
MTMAAEREPPAARIQARLHGVHGGADPGLLVLLRADQLSLFLRRHADHSAGRHLAGKRPAGVDVRGRDPDPADLWVVDFTVRIFGVSLTGTTDYMFNPNTSLFLRGLSLFHGWLPFLLVYLVWKLGYDRRGLPAWTGLAWVLLLVCFFLMPPPRPDPGLTPVNINYVWGPSDFAAQTWVHPYVWLVGLMIVLPVIFLLAHLLLVRFAPKAPA